MLQAHARISSEKASRYLAQLCKHFAHKIPVEWSGTRGRADFGMGRCELTADADRLLVVCSAPTSDGLEKVKHIVEDHIVRFGWREKLTVTWCSGPGEPLS